MSLDNPKTVTVLPTDQPIDRLVANLMTDIHRKGRGFVLGLDKDYDGKAVIEVKESLPPHDNYEPPAAYRAHTIGDTDSFIAYALRYGNEKGSLVLYNESGVTLSIQEEVTIGDRELICLNFTESDDWREWTQMLGKKVTHRDLLRFLMSHEQNLGNPDVLKAMQSLKLNSQVNLESDVRDDGQTIGIMIKTNAGEEMKKFPKTFGILIPVLDQDVLSDDVQPQKTLVRLETILPDDPKKGPEFTLFDSEWRQIKRRRIDAEGKKIAEALPGWTVVHGSHQTNDRDMGGE